MRVVRTSLTVIALAALIVAPVHAVDQPILGSSLKVKNPSSPDKRKVSVKAKEKASPNTVAGDPVLNGATLTVRANGTTPSQQILSLPQGTSSTGKPFWSGDAATGFKYADSKGDQGPVRSVRIKKSGSGTFQVSTSLSGKVQALNVVPPNVGTDGCAFLLIGGGSDSYSVKFTGGVVTNNGAKEYSHKKVTTEGSCAPTCSDGIQNGTETDVDCGGAACPVCDPGDTCNGGTDCSSGVCTGNVCQGPTCIDGVQNGDETDIDCGGTCPDDCQVDQACILNNDCVTSLCSGSLCKCPNHLYTFTVSSNAGGAFDSAEWPGGTVAQTATPTCNVAVNLPDDNIDLVGGLAAPFSIDSFLNYSSCFGTGGEDGDGCQPLTCPPAGIGQCSMTRPSCSAALNGSGSAQYFVQCLQ